MTQYSHSKLSTFEQCPLKFKYQYIDEVKDKQPQTIENFMGNRVHETLEKLYRDLKLKKRNTLDVLLLYYEDIWNKNKVDGVRVVKKDYTIQNYHDTGAQCIRNYYNRFNPFGQNTIIDVERGFDIPLDGDGKHNLKGKIDRLDRRNDGTFEIHDYKTAQNLPDKSGFLEDRQLVLYEMAIRHNFDGVRGVELIWHYLVHDQDIRLTITPERIANVLEETKTLIEKIEITQEFPHKESVLCNWCEFMHLCPIMKHPVSVELLPVNEYLNDDGVKLVNEYIKWHEQEQEAKREKEKVRTAVEAYAEREGTLKIDGSNNILKLWKEKGYSFPTKTNDGEEAVKEFEKVIKDIGLWDDFSQYNWFKLSKELDQLPDDKKKVLGKYATKKTGFRIYINQKG